MHKLNAFLTRHTLEHHQKREGRIGITECVLWSNAVNVNPTFQRLTWAVGICVTTFLLSLFASFVLSDAEPFVVSRTATTQHSSNLTQQRLEYYNSVNKSLRVIAQMQQDLLLMKKKR